MAGKLIEQRGWFLFNFNFCFNFICTRIAASAVNLCLDDLQSAGDDPYNLGVYVCHRPNVTKSQFFSLTDEGLLRSEESCATVQNR